LKNSEIREGVPNGVHIAFDVNSGRSAARYVSALMVREEALEHTRLIGLYWSASGHVHRENVVKDMPGTGLNSLYHPLHVFELEIDGQSLHNRWEWAGAYQRDSDRQGCVEAVVELVHQVRPIRLNVVTRLDGTSAMVRWLEIKNEGSAPAALSHVSPWSGLIWKLEPDIDPAADTESPFALGYLKREEWGAEGDFTWQSLPCEAFRIERRQGTSHGSPYFVLRNQVTGEIAFIALAWSGNFFAEFSRRPEDALFFRMGPMGPAPMRVIKPGETVMSPAVHFMIYHGDIDSAGRAWNEHIRASVIQPRPAGREMYTVAGRVVEEPGDWILKEIDIAAEMGIEAFMVDAGWYGEKFSGWWDNRGDWFEGDWLPGGMGGIREHAKKKGLLFGVWLEAEAMSEDTRMYKEHPDWELTTDDGRRLPSLAPNMADPEVIKHVEDAVFHVVRDFGVDFFKLDYNVKIGEGGQNLCDGYAEWEYWRHIEAIYRIFDRVRKEFPNVVLENCAAGGSRNDLGMMSRFHYCCESDWSVHPFGIRAINAMTLFLPPEAICYYHNHIQHCHQTADLDTHLRVILFATPIFVGFGAQSADRSTEYFKKTKRYIELAKTFCRPVMANRPDVYHHTPDIGLTGRADWCVLEYASPEKTRGYAGIFKLRDEPSEFVFRAKGVDAGRNYIVTLDNSGAVFEMSGVELQLAGIPVRLDSALTSELVMYDEVGE